MFIEYHKGLQYFEKHLQEISFDSYHDGFQTEGKKKLKEQLFSQVYCFLFVRKQFCDLSPPQSHLQRTEDVAEERGHETVFLQTKSNKLG